MKHITSPLSVALFVFGVGKSAQSKHISAWWHSKLIRFNHRQRALASEMTPLGTQKRTLMTAARPGIRPLAAPRSASTSFRIGDEFRRQTSPLYQRQSPLLGLNRQSPLSTMKNFGSSQKVAAQRRMYSASASKEELAKELETYWDPSSVSDVLNHASDLWLPKQFEMALEALHGFTGLAWWMDIAIATILLRTVTMPVNILFLRNQLRLKLIRHQVEVLGREMKESHDPKVQLERADQIQALYKEKKCHPMFWVDWVIPTLFPPFFLSYFTAIHNLCLTNVSMSEGGLLWFVDLMSHDTSMLLPITSALTWLALTERVMGNYYFESGRLKLWTRLAAVSMISLTGTVPCGVFVFWIVSNLWEIARVRIVARDDVRRALGIPLLSELPPVKPSAW